MLNDRLLRAWLRCRRKAWLDLHGPRAERHWHPQRAIQLAEQHRLLDRFARHHGGLARAGVGLDGLKTAQPLVRQLRLRSGGLPLLEGIPSLLLREARPSAIGAHGYAPVIVRLGRRITRAHRLGLALWSDLLATHLGRPAPTGWVVGRDRPAEPIALDTPRRQLTGVLEQLEGDLAKDSPPALIHDRRLCRICSWKRSCDGAAAAAGDLSEVSGIGGKRRELLQQLLIHNVEHLAAADPDQLQQELDALGEQNRGLAGQLVLQARTQLGHRPVRRPGGGAGPLLPELNGAAGVLLYDIESDPDARENFLHGFLVLPRGSTDFAMPDTGRYHPVLALKEHGEAQAWQRLQRLLRRFPDWPLLHYGQTERVELLGLARRQQAGPAELENLRQRLVDLHERLHSRWVMPLNGYGLKAIAAWIGFRWRQPLAEGARCVLWWRQWRARRRRHDLQRILDYNADDCRATWVVARWLRQQDTA